MPIVDGPLVVGGRDDRQREIVTIGHADLGFEKKDYGVAALYYARSSCSFEQVALTFLNKGEPAPILD